MCCQACGVVLSCLGLPRGLATQIARFDSSGFSVYDGSRAHHGPSDNQPTLKQTIPRGGTALKHAYHMREAYNRKRKPIVDLCLVGGIIAH